MSEEPHHLGTIEEVASTAQSPATSTQAVVHEDESEEEFVYPGIEPGAAAPTETIRDAPEATTLSTAPEAEQLPNVLQAEDEEDFVYPGSDEPSTSSSEVPSQPHSPRLPEPEPEAVPEAEPAQTTPETAVVQQQTSVEEATSSVVRPTSRHPSSIELEALIAAAQGGDLSRLRNTFKSTLETGEVERFALANDASLRSGLTALHVAASRGHLEVVRWLIEECGAMPDLEDKEGETALHKAALNGHISIVQYLLPDMADVQAQDADGWTALHNACSKGYLDIVRWLCEQGGATTEFKGAPGVDIRSKGGWTPLMNAASKGHLPVVLYLINKQSADPLVRNNWGETAYDVAAAVFEVWICEVLQKAEAEKWRGTTVPYNPLAVHTSVPLIVYEHQKLDMRLKTLAVSGGKPKFSAHGLGRRGRRAPFELRLPRPDEGTGKKELPAWRSDVHLPLKEEPFKLPVPGASDGREGAERSHFWLSDWTLDVTHPGVDAQEGWQYAHTFEDADDQWTAEQSPQLQRLLSGNGAVTAGLSGGSSSRSSGSRSSSTSRSRSGTAQHWVRRRRWVRVMRRRLDIPPLPFMQPDGAMYILNDDGILTPFIENHDDSFVAGEGQELGFMPSSGLPSAQDYVARARYLAGTQHEDNDPNAGPASALETRRAIAKLERATTELRQGILNDEDGERKTQAEVLLNAYSRELERRRLAAGAQGLFISGDSEEETDDDDSDEEFHYPGSTPPASGRPPSTRSSTTAATDYFSRQASTSRGPTDLTPHLSQAPEFRVPTHEAPQKVLSPRHTPTPHQVHATWERDEAVTQCRDCRRRFTFILRRHCRRCGRIFCDRCSCYRALLDPSEIVFDPVYPEPTYSTSSQRVCQGCYEEVNASVPNGLHSSLSNSMERIVVDQRRLSIPSPTMRAETSSQISDLADCPVCGANLADIGTATLQEAHVRNCLEGGTGSSPQSAKYLVYKLPGESALIGTECVICLEEFVQGSMVARLSCLCSFHNACLSSWLQRGRSCPVHAR